MSVIGPVQPHYHEGSPVGKSNNNNNNNTTICKAP